MNAAEPEELYRPSLNIRGIVTALPDFLLTGVFLITWLSPFALGESIVPNLMLLMLLEFVNVNVAPFFGMVLFNTRSRNEKILMVLGLGLLCTLFIIGFSISFKEWWPLAAFWLMLVNRLLFLLTGQVIIGKESKALKRSWQIGLIAYIVLSFLTTILPFPELGLTPTVVNSIAMPVEMLDRPQRVMALGFLYFLTLALTQVVFHRFFFKNIPVKATQGIS